MDEMLTLLYFRCANPSYTVSELVHVLHLSKSKVILVHPPSLSVAVEAAKQVGLSAKNIIVFNVPGESTPGGFATIDDLIVKGLRRPQGYVEPILKAEEAKTKLAFLSFSSGTTGKPKVSC
jgi:4-coumarate--CoA ligase